ncbi:unnamed protein product [Calicophoron daubneyi]|uniref:Pericentriolar material 1 protein C-terminal domain-containing protein n=1 Tax=Calicophoron daubneyi TaxID=300641 RepID=A0AAV2TE03_CALDB
MNSEKEFIRTLEMSKGGRQTAHKKPQTSQASLLSTNSARERSELDLAERSLDDEPHSFNGLTELEKLRQERDALRQALKRQEDLRAHYGRQIAQLNKIKKKHEENWPNQLVMETNKSITENVPNGISSVDHWGVVANAESGEQSFDISATPTVLAELGELVKREETLNDFIEQIELSLPKPPSIHTENAQSTSRCCTLPANCDFNRNSVTSQTKSIVNIPSIPLNEVEPVNGHLFSGNNSCDWDVKEFNNSDKLKTRQCMVGKLNQLMGIRQQFVDIRNQCKSAAPSVNSSSECDLDPHHVRPVNGAGTPHHLQNPTSISPCSLNEAKRLNSVQENNSIFNWRGQSESHWPRRLSTPRKDTPKAHYTSQLLWSEAASRTGGRITMLAVEKEEFYHTYYFHCKDAVDRPSSRNGNEKGEMGLEARQGTWMLSNTATNPRSNRCFGATEEVYLPPDFIDSKAVTSDSRITKNNKQREVSNEVNFEESPVGDEEEDKLSLASSVLRCSDPRMISQCQQNSGIARIYVGDLKTTQLIHLRPRGHVIDHSRGSYHSIIPQAIGRDALTSVNTISPLFPHNREQPSMRNSTWLSPNLPNHFEPLTDRKDSHGLANEPNFQLHCNPYENVRANNDARMRIDSCLAVDQMTCRRAWSVSPNLSRGHFLPHSHEGRNCGFRRLRGPSDILRDGNFIRNMRNGDTSGIPWRFKNTYKPTNMVGMNGLDELAYEVGNKFDRGTVNDVSINSYALQHERKRKCCSCCALQNRLYLSLGQICVQLNHLTREMLSTHRQMSQFYPNGMTSCVPSSSPRPAQRTVTPAPNIYWGPPNHFPSAAQNTLTSTPAQQQLFVWNPLGTTAVGTVPSPGGLFTPTVALNLQDTSLDQQAASSVQASTSFDKNTDVEFSGMPLSSARETKNCQPSLALATGEEDVGIDDVEENTLAKEKSETIPKVALNVNPKIEAAVSDPVHISVECENIDLTAVDPETSKPTVTALHGFDMPSVPLLNADETNRSDLQAVYREVVCLIAQHDKDPEFLVRLFSSLRKLTRYRRQKTNVLDYLAICISQLQLERSKRRLMGSVSSRESSVSRAWTQSNSKLNDPIEAFFSDRDSMRDSQHMSRRLSRKCNGNGGRDHKNGNISRQTDMSDSQSSLDSASQYLDPVYVIPTPKVSYAEAELRRKLLEHKKRPSTGSPKFESRGQMLTPKTVPMRTDSCHSVSCATESPKTTGNQYTTFFDNLDLNGTVMHVDEMRKQLRERNSTRIGPSSGAGDCPSVCVDQNSIKQDGSSEKINHSVEIPVTVDYVRTSAQSSKIPSVDGSVDRSERSQTGSLCSDASIRERTESVLSHIIRHLRYMCSHVDPSSAATKPLKMNAGLSSWLCESVQNRFRRLVCAKYGKTNPPKNPGASSKIEAPPAEDFHSLTPEFMEVFCKQLGTQIQEVTSQFEGQNLVDCIEDLVIELSDMLTEELAFLTIMTGPKDFDLRSQASTMTSLSSFCNHTDLHNVVACEYADGRGGDSERNTRCKTRNTAGESGGGRLSADEHCSESEKSYKDEDWEPDNVGEGGDKRELSGASTRQTGANRSDIDCHIHDKLHRVGSSEVSESETKYLFGTNDVFGSNPDLNPDIVESIEDLAEPAEDLSTINAAFENLLDGAIFEIPEAPDLEDVAPVTLPGNNISEESEKNKGLPLFSGHVAVSGRLEEEDKNAAKTAAARIVSEVIKDATSLVSTDHSGTQPAVSDTSSATECKPVPNHTEQD